MNNAAKRANDVVFGICIFLSTGAKAVRLKSRPFILARTRSPQPEQGRFVARHGLELRVAHCLQSFLANIGGKCMHTPRDTSRKMPDMAIPPEFRDMDPDIDTPPEMPDPDVSAHEMDLDESADTPRKTPDIGELHGATKHAIDRLGSLYSMEASAARSYDKALATPCLAPYREAFGLNRSSHEERVRLLRDRIQLAGGEPPQTPSISDSLLELFEDAAVTLSASSAVGVLERREERWLDEYNKALNVLHRENRQFVAEHLLPRQLQSRGALQAFKHSN